MMNGEIDIVRITLTMVKGGFNTSCCIRADEALWNIARKITGRDTEKEFYDEIERLTEKYNINAYLSEIAAAAGKALFGRAPDLSIDKNALALTKILGRRNGTNETNI